MAKYRQAMQNRWTRLGAVVVAVFMAATIFIGAETVGQGLAIPPPWDKAVHFLYYGTMALLIAHGVGRHWLIVPLLVVPLVGVFDEWRQSHIPGRDASFFDWLADELGTVAFVYFYSRLSRGG